MAFREVSRSTMEGVGLLPPSLVEHVTRRARQDAHAAREEAISLAVKVFMNVFTADSGGLPITEEQARERVLALMDAPEAETEPPPAPAQRKQARRSAKPNATQAAKPKAQPAKKQAAKKAAKKKAALKAAASDETPPAWTGKLPRRELLGALALPLNTSMKFSAAFMKRLKQVSLNSLYPREMLIKMDVVTGKPRDPVRVAGALNAWVTRTVKSGRTPKPRVIVSPEEQIKRSRRGKLAAETKIAKISRTRRVSPARAAKLLMRPVAEGRKAA